MFQVNPYIIYSRDTLVLDHLFTVRSFCASILNEKCGKLSIV
jgi:hypothetical protein